MKHETKGSGSLEETAGLMCLSWMTPEQVLAGTVQIAEPGAVVWLCVAMEAEAEVSEVYWRRDAGS